jgi:hypothetical protein
MAKSKKVVVPKPKDKQKRARKEGDVYIHEIFDGREWQIIMRSELLFDEYKTVLIGEPS